MPLMADLHDCGAKNCENETHYYKIVWIPYPEGIRVSTQRGTRGKEAHLFLCPEHYPMPEGDYTILDVTAKVKQDEF